MSIVEKVKIVNIILGILCVDNVFMRLLCKWEFI